MSTKNIERIIQPSGTHFVGDGFKVHNIIPGVQGLSMQRMSPFIMLDYNAPFYFSPSEIPRGVDVHPHRGFETVTIAYKCKVEHHDSSGGGGIIAEGDVQWMTAASGVLHKEFHEKEWSKQGGIFQMVQLWVNLPAQYKMSAPKYQAIANSSIPKYFLPNELGIVEVIAGHYQALNGAASTFSPVHLLNVKLEATASATFGFPAHYNTAVLVLEGAIEINGQQVPTNAFAMFENSGEEFTIKAKEKAQVLVLSGEPINEPIAVHGPFVMNTRQEIMQAMHDYNTGKFGYLD